MSLAFETLILIDQPYVSAALQATIVDQALPVVDTPAAREMGLLVGPHILSETQAKARGKQADRLRLYTNSENALSWVAEHLVDSRSARAAALFKNKVRFRQATRSLDPDFEFVELSLDTLDQVNPQTLPMPCVLKPAVGFFSIGVRRIEQAEDWPAAVAEVTASLESARGLYPDVVLNDAHMIVESCLEGDEYAVDAYFDGRGQPVVVGIMKHLFVGPDDVSDRVYTTSAKVMKKMLPLAFSYLERLGQLVDLQDVALHVELRVGPDGIARAIEVNPLRFGGWCTTSDLATHAWGFDPIMAFLRDEQPDWSNLMQEQAGRSFSVVVLDNATGQPGHEIPGFDHAGVAAGFSNVIEIRPVDHRVHPLFGFLFVETPENDPSELLAILGDDLRGHIEARQVDNSPVSPDLGKPLA